MISRPHSVGDSGPRRRASSAHASQQHPPASRSGGREGPWTITLAADAVDFRTLNLNARPHWAAKAEAVANVRDLVGAEARQLGIGRHDHITAVLTFHPPTAARRDRINLALVHKAAIDGLVDAAVIPDDTPDHLTDLMPRIGTKAKPARWVLTVLPGRHLHDLGDIA